MAEWDPEVVGLSIMTFQRATAFAVMDLVRAIKPGVRIVVGGYDPSLARTPTRSSPADFLVAGEGEITFRELLRAIERGDGFEAIDGLSLPRRRRVPAQPQARHRQARRRGDPPAQPCGPRALRLRHDRAPATSSRPRAAAPSTAASAPSSRCAGATSTASRSNASSRTSPTPRRTARADLPGRRQHRARCPALHRAVPRHHRRRAAHDRLHRAGDDLDDRRPWCRAGAADAPRRVPLRLPRHRKRAAAGSRLPQGGEQEPQARGRQAQRQCRDRRDPAHPRATACSWSAA